AAVETVQSLRKRGLEVHVAARADCPAVRSRWAARTLVQPATASPRRFTDWLRGLPHEYSLVVPSTGYSLHPLASLPARVRCAPGTRRAAGPRALARSTRQGQDSRHRGTARSRRAVVVTADAPRRRRGRRRAKRAQPVHSLLEGAYDLTEAFPTLV